MSYSALVDTELLQLILQEDENAFAEIYNRYWKRIYTIAFSYTRSSEAAQDIVQDVFLKIWVNKDTLVQIREFKPYLFVTARNLIISSLRNKVFHVSLDPEEQVEEETFLPERQLSYKESVDLLHKAIDLLPPQQQRAYKLSRNEGMRYEDIAQEMGISPLTVRTHITKALSFIRKYLIDNAVHPVLLLMILLCKK
jgi:RNA polymerase sigma-70 factor (family 1)